MSEPLLIVLVVLVTWAVAVAVGWWLVRRRLQRANRVARGVPTAAPARWLWSPSSMARLHRRIQAAVWAIDPDGDQYALPPSPGSDALRAELAAVGVALDERLAALRTAPRRARARETRRVARSVRTLEGLSAALAAPDASLAPAPGPPERTCHLRERLEELSQRIGQLQESRTEVAGLDDPVLGEQFLDNLAAGDRALPAASPRDPAWGDPPRTDLTSTDPAAGQFRTS